jgi:chorismate mutase/prephenate dehydratase
LVPPTLPIDELRERIDRIDDQLLKLLSRRARLAIKVGEQKRGVGRSVYAPQREKDIFRRLASLNQGPLDAEGLRPIYREIIAACLSLEEQLQVAFLGPLGTFSHAAVSEQFGSRAEPVPVNSIAEVFDEVEHRRVTYGVVPVENSTEGVVAATLDRFASSTVTIKAEVLLRIEQCLLVRPGHRGAVRKIVSHPQSLGQCRQWLAQHYPGVPCEEAASNGTAAEIAKRQAGTVAIAGRGAGERYGLRVLARNIQDQANNFTRFFVLGRDGIGPRSDDDKSSLLLSVPHKAGALYRVLEPFADHGVSLNSIDSRPLKGRPWEYLFFLDLVGHIEEPRVARCLAELEKLCLSVKVMGSYSAALGAL